MAKVPQSGVTEVTVIPVLAHSEAHTLSPTLGIRQPSLRVREERRQESSSPGNWAEGYGLGLQLLGPGSQAS